MTRDEMIKLHDAIDAADAYLLGFEKNGKIYMKLMKELKDDMLKLDHCSSARGGWPKVKIYVSAKAKAMMIAQGAQIIGSIEELKQDKKHNRGDNFERIIVEKLCGGQWSKNSTPWYIAGDVELNGKQIQVKLDGAELTTENTIRNAYRKLGKALA